MASGISEQFFSSAPLRPNLDGLPSAERFRRYRAYKSPMARRFLAMRAASWDLMHAIEWCDLLIEHPPELVLLGSRPDVAPKALWDAALVAFRKHFGRGADKGVKRLYESVKNSNEQTRSLCSQLENERDRRVAHPAGDWESHMLGFLMDEEEEHVVHSGALVAG